MGLEGKVALVTGATRGIGEEIARRFARSGAQVALLGRNPERGDQVAKDITADGGEAVFIRTDVGLETDVRSAIAHTVDRFGQLNLIVNNAAPTDVMAANTKQLTDFHTEEFEAIMRVALYGTVWTCMHGIPEMIRSGGGSIVNISSMASIMGFPGMTAYTCAKGAMNALTRQLAVECGPQGVRVNAIIVGIIINELTAAVASTPQLRTALDAMHLTPRLGENRDIASLAEYLGSDDSGFITGQQIVVDGGSSVKAPLPSDMVELGTGAKG